MKEKPVELLDDGYFGKYVPPKLTINSNSFLKEEFILLHFLIMHYGIQVKENQTKFYFQNFFLENHSNVLKEWMD